MPFDKESIIAIVAILVSLPPSLLILWKLSCRLSVLPCRVSPFRPGLASRWHGTAASEIVLERATHTNEAGSLLYDRRYYTAVTSSFSTYEYKISRRWIGLRCWAAVIKNESRAGWYNDVDIRELVGGSKTFVWGSWSKRIYQRVCVDVGKRRAISSLFTSSWLW